MVGPLGGRTDKGAHSLQARVQGLWAWPSQLRLGVCVGGVAQVGRGMGGATLTPCRDGLPPQPPEATSAPQEQVGLPLSGPALSLLQQAPQRAQGRYLTLCVLECSIHALYAGSHVSQDPSLHGSRIDGVQDEL